MTENTQEQLNTADWASMGKEIDDLFDDTDSESNFGGSQADGNGSEGFGTDDDAPDAAGSRSKGKRPLSDPPSPASSSTRDDASPLSKRRKIAAGRKSNLKVSFRAEPSSEAPAPPADSPAPGRSSDEFEDEGDLDGIADLINANFT